LIFVVLFGSTYGINYGIAAAAAESLSLIRALKQKEAAGMYCSMNLQTGFHLSFILRLERSAVISG